MRSCDYISVARNYKLFTWFHYNCRMKIIHPIVASQLATVEFSFRSKIAHQRLVLLPVFFYNHPLASLELNRVYCIDGFNM